MSEIPSIEQLKYPVGEFEMPEEVTETMVNKWIDTIANFPAAVEQALGPKEALQWKYRPEGWTIAQVIHHCADSHANAVIRFKLALTEENPTIKPYFENLWAELPDMEAPVEESLSILRGLHARWARLLRTLTPKDLQKTFIHPEHNRSFTLKETIGMYDWHSRHHLAHIHQAIKYQGVFNQ